MWKSCTQVVASLSLMLFLSMSEAALADVQVVNGDFAEPGFFLDPTWGQFYHDIPFWGELNEDVTWDDMLIDASAGAYNDEDFTAGMAGWRGEPSGYIYQEIGTPDGAAQLRVTGVNFWRDNGQNQYDDLVVAVYRLEAGHFFEFEEFGNDILDEGELVDVERVIPAPAEQNASVPFDEHFSLADLAPNDRLFLRFSAAVNPDLPTRDVWAYVDDVAAELVGGGGGVKLLAGDADQDLKFDQLDLVKVQIAAKYLTGSPATWGEGDWNGAPGGQPGSPPAGDGQFNQLDIISALGAGVYLTGPYAALTAGGVASDGQTSVGYDAATGELWVDAPAGTELTSINIDSAAAVFRGEAARNLGGSFDNDADDNIFKATFGSSFGSLTFGNVAQAGLSEQFVLNDLTVIGSLNGGGGLGDVDLIYVPVPEPCTTLLLACGVLSLMIVRIAGSNVRPCVGGWEWSNSGVNQRSLIPIQFLAGFHVATGK